MWRYDRPEPRAWRRTYVYLKTRLALEYSYEAVNLFRKRLGETANLLWLSDDQTWEDGFVFCFDALKDAPDVAQDWNDILGNFEAWAILDDKGRFSENIRGGPVHHFFKNAKPPDAPRINYSQIFLAWDEENQWAKQAAENIRSDLRGYCSPVFFFRDGQILFLASEESGNITIQRCRRHLRALTGWCIVDTNGETFSPNGRDDKRWEWTELQNLISTD